MAENKQNSETKNTGNDNKTTASSGAASTGQAKGANSSAAAPSKAGNPTDSSIGKDAPATSSSSSGGGNQSNAQNASTTNVKETVAAAASEAVGQAKEKAGSVLDEQKSTLASGITSVADSIRHVGENLSNTGEDNQIAQFAGRYGDTIAQQVERLSDYVNDRDIRELARDVEQFARRNPTLFVAGAFAVGVLAARFLKSSAGGGGNTARGARLGNGGSNRNALQTTGDNL